MRYILPTSSYTRADINSVYKTHEASVFWRLYTTLQSIEAPFSMDTNWVYMLSTRNSPSYGLPRYVILCFCRGCTDSAYLERLVQIITNIHKVSLLLCMKTLTFERWREPKQCDNVIQWENSLQTKRNMQQQERASVCLSGIALCLDPLE